MTIFPSYTLVVDPQTGLSSVHYDVSPEQFVQQLRAEDAYFSIARGACTECPYYGADPCVPPAMLRDAEAHMLPVGRCLECVKGAVARYRRDLRVPDFLGCYGFYYLHSMRVPYLDALTRGGRIAFVDTRDLHGLRESGLSLLVPDWYE